MNKAALVVIFNHRYEKNIPKLEEYYGSRFQHRSYLVPFAPTESDQILRVVENGWCFSGHIAQAATRFKVADVTHYVFAGDDLILNPALDQTSILDALCLDESSGYIKSLSSADRVRFGWPWSIYAYNSLRNAKYDYKRELPTAEQAKARFERMGLTFPTPVPRKGDTKWLHYPAKVRTLKELYWNLKLLPDYIGSLTNFLLSMRKPSSYPLLAGYSDFVVVPAKDLDLFAHYCGVFAAMNMFAEVAVPTALALACDTVKTEIVMGGHFADPKPSRVAGLRWHGLELWEGEIGTFAQSLQYSWEAFIKHFPDDALYTHPVKLSQWK